MKENVVEGAPRSRDISELWKSSDFIKDLIVWNFSLSVMLSIYNGKNRRIFFCANLRTAVKSEQPHWGAVGWV